MTGEVLNASKHEDTGSSLLLLSLMEGWQEGAATDHLRTHHPQGPAPQSGPHHLALSEA